MAIGMYNQTAGSNRWGTPEDFLANALKTLDYSGVGLDCAAEDITALSDNYFGPDQKDPNRRDALRVSWDFPADGRLVRFLNPPYSIACAVCTDRVWKNKHSKLPEKFWCSTRGHKSTDLSSWIAKAALEGSREGQAPLLCLIPCRTDTGWWHRYVMEKAQRVYLIAGRISYLRPEPDGSLVIVTSAPMPSALVVYTGPNPLQETSFGRLSSLGLPVTTTDTWRTQDD